MTAAVRRRGPRQSVTWLWATMALAAAALTPLGLPPAAADDPPGLSVSGPQLLKDGRAYVPQGFNMVALLTPAWCSRYQTAPAEQSFGEATMELARQWNVSALRFQVSQEGLTNPNVTQAERDAYLERVQAGVALARDNGFDVIVSMQDQYFSCGPAHPLPSAATSAAWSVLAPVFATDPYVMFELFNEPDLDNDAAGWQQWQHGGLTPSDNLGAPAVGHQELIDQIRALGNTNVLIADALRKGARTAGMPLLSDPTGNLIYGVHPYYFSLGPDWWELQYGALAATVPLIATEWNYKADKCATASEDLAPELLAYLYEHEIGVFGHAFDMPGTIVADLLGTPTECGSPVGGSGQVLQDFFLSDKGPPPDTVSPSVPTGLTARINSPTSVSLAWQPSDDDVGVVAYEVTRNDVALGSVPGESFVDTTHTPNATHGYAVRALDAAGNQSAAASIAVAVPAVAPTGLTGSYFDTAVLTSQRLTRNDKSVSFSWGTGSPAANIGRDTFSVRWTGRLLPLATGTHTFYTQSDNGARLWVNGQRIINNWTNATASEVQGTIALQSNQAYAIRLEYAEQTGAASVALRWSGPGVPKQVIPASQLLAR